MKMTANFKSSRAAREPSAAERIRLGASARVGRRRVALGKRRELAALQSPAKNASLVTTNDCLAIEAKQIC
jgi:hypothetical protein